MPFAIICDKTNEYTDSFDDVVILQNATRSYVDKLSLTSLAPFEKTIFIDSDCLAYRDLNDLWDLFREAPPFCALGSVLSFDSDDGWFKREDVGIFSDKVRFHISFHGGAYYIERSNPTLNAFSDTVTYVHQHYLEYKFRHFPKPSDETVFSLAMAVSGFAPVAGAGTCFCFLPRAKSVKADIRNGSLSYEAFFKQSGLLKRYENVYLLHWGHHKYFWLFFRQSLALTAESESTWTACCDFFTLFRFFRFRSMLKKMIPYRLKRAIYLANTWIKRVFD